MLKSQVLNFNLALRYLDATTNASPASLVVILP